MAVKEGFEPSIRRTYGSLAGLLPIPPKATLIIGWVHTDASKHNNEHNRLETEQLPTYRLAIE